MKKVLDKLKQHKSTIIKLLFILVGTILVAIIASQPAVKQFFASAIDKIIPKHHATLFFSLLFLLLATLTFFIQRYLKMRNEVAAMRKIKSALKESDALFRSYFELGMVGKAITSSNKRWLMVNDSLCSMLGYSRKEMLKKSWTEMTHPDDLESDIRQFKRMEDGEIEGYIIDKRFIRKDSSVIYVNLAVCCIRDSENNITHVIASTLDVTERKRAEAQIRALTKKLFKSQEEERLRLSRDLHDNVAQELSSLKIGFSTLFDNEPDISETVKNKMEILSNILQQSIRSIRNMAYHLRPPGLDQLGLVAAISRFCKDYREISGIKVDFSSVGVESLNLHPEAEINIYRIVQEAMNNILKHADADMVTVRLIASFPVIIMRIHDNGKGFEIDNDTLVSHDEHSMGLQSMQERVSLLDGTFNIKSSRDNGTNLYIEIPIKE